MKMAKRSLLVIPQITSTCLIPRMTQHENLKFLLLRRGEKRQVIKMTYSHVLSHHHHLGAHLLVLFVLKWIISHHFIVKCCFKNTCRISMQIGLGWGGVCVWVVVVVFFGPVNFDKRTMKKQVLVVPMISK